MPWALDIKSGLILPTFENVQIYPLVTLIFKNRANIDSDKNINILKDILVELLFE